jgi:hypothetical protein
MAPKSRGEQPDFVFLSYAPNPNRKSQAIQDTQRRAHAARKSHALARQKRGVSDPSSSEEASSSTSPESPKNSPPKESTPNDVLFVQPIEDPDEMQTIYSDDDSQSVALSDQMQIWSPAQNTPPATLLGQGTVDPFDAFAVKGLPPYVYKVLDIGK